MPVALMSLGQNVFYVPMLEVESPWFRDPDSRHFLHMGAPRPSEFAARVAIHWTGPGHYRHRG